MNPLATGAYPTEMVTYVDGDRLPTFKDDEAAMVKGSYDFIGVNYYTAQYAKDIQCDKSQESYITDPCVSLSCKLVQSICPMYFSSVRDLFFNHYSTILTKLPIANIFHSKEKWKTNRGKGMIIYYQILI